jgi:hypothetical protein
MDGKPTGPAPGANAPDALAEDGSENGEHETFGVLELSRRSKDDGRALLVFRRSPATR